MSDKSAKKYVSRRRKVKTVPFELDESISSYKRKSGGGGSETKALIYLRNEFLAVRNDEDGFFLCRCVQHVYETTKQFSIHWLEQDPQDESTFGMAYLDTMDLECVLTDVRLQRIGKDKYQLPANQKLKIDKALLKSVQGKESSDDGNQSDGEPPKKKAKLDHSQSKVKKTLRTKAKAGSKVKKGLLTKKGSLKKTSSTLAAAKGIKKRVLKKTSSKAKAAHGKSKTRGVRSKTDSKTNNISGVARKGKKGVLIPRPSINVLDKDPFLASKEKVPFISTLAHSKLVLRAAFLNDNKLLKEVIDDRDHIAKLDITHSEGFRCSALKLALEHENLVAADLLCKQLFVNDEKRPQRVAMTTSLLKTESTGQYNKLSLYGVPFIRKLNMSRGSKEGNNAFTKDLALIDDVDTVSDCVKYAIEKGVSKKTLDRFSALTNNEAKQQCYNHIDLAVEMGHRKLAAALIDDVIKSGLPNFNFLHHDVLAFDNEDLRSGIKEVSVKKRPFNNSKITPLHCAAINPNPKYLSKLLSILPDYNIMDATRRRLVHYAAACEGTGPLELLLDRGVNAMEVDSSGISPLFLACNSGRLHNVELLLSRAKQALDSETSNKTTASKSDEDDDEKQKSLNKYGLCGMNMGVTRPNSEIFSYTPLHVAAIEGHTDIVKILLDYGANIDKELAASKNKLSPLMIAALSGHIEVVRFLVKRGAKPSQKDKLKRTAMMLAAMNGHAHIVSLFLSYGCNPNDQDSSGNTALHYAAGYGWYFCVKIILEAGANPNTPNNWKTTPMAIAFLKGHVGLADVLLDQPSVDINFRLDGGMTLVHMACSSALVEGIVQQLEYLVIKKKADCTLVDDAKNNALHHLAQNSILGEITHWPQPAAPCKLMMERSVQISKILIQHGCNASAKDANGMTPVMLAIQQGNQLLLEFLVENAADISNTLDKENRNILHFLSARCMKQSLAGILKMIHKTTSDAGIMTEMAKQVDSSGMTPLILACSEYRNWTVKDSEGEQRDADNDSDKAEEEESAEDKEEHEEAENGENESEAASDEEEEKEEENKGDVKVEEMDEDETDDHHGRETLNTSQTNSSKKAECKAICSEAGRKYIFTLLEICGDSANIPLQKKMFKATDTVPEKEEDQYFNKAVAGFSAVHFLVGVPHEFVSSPEGDAIANQCPGLTGLLQSMQNKSSADMFDCSGRTPLLVAIVGKHEAAARKLIEFGVDVNAKSHDKDNDGLGSALLLAARCGLHEIISLLLHHGSNVSVKDVNNQYTALHYVIKCPVSSCFKTVVESLLAHKASVTEVDKQQKTPLHLLMEFSKDISDAVAVAGQLLTSGALIDACDRKGRTPLHLAVNANSGSANSSTEMEQFLLDKGANQFARDWLQRLPLHYVFVKIGKHTAVTAMDPVELCSTLTGSTNKPGSMVNYGDQFGLTPLHVAARRGAGVCCIHLIEKGSNVNVRDFDGNTPLSLAIANKHESCTILLLQRNADISGNIVIVPPPPPKPESDDVKGDGPEKTKTKKVKPEWKWKLLKPVEKPAESQTYSLFQGVVSQDWQGIIFLMIDQLQKFSLTLLNVVQAALLTRKYHLALSLIRKVRNRNELTGKMECDQNLAHILAKASEAKKEDNLVRVVAQMLLDKGVSFDSEDEYGCTPLHYACLQGSIPLIEFIIDCCKNINLEKKDKLGRTPMAAAFWKLGHHGKLTLEVAKRLGQQGATLDLLCSYPGQQIFVFGQKSNVLEEEYLRSSASNTLISPLMLSIYHHDFDLTRELIGLGASVNFPDVDGRTPLMLAVSENNVHLVRLLLDHSYVISAVDEDEITVAPVVPQRMQKHGSRKIFAIGKSLQKHPSIQKSVVKDKVTGAKCEMIFVNGINMSTKVYTKTSGVNEKALDSKGRSALHYLVQPLPNGSFDNYRLLQQLVSIGAPLQQVDNNHKTVMDYAIAQGLPKLVTTIQYLLDKDKVLTVIPKYTNSCVNDGVLWDTPAPDYTRDSESLVEQFEQALAAEEGLTETEYKAVPDQCLSDCASGQVLIDTDLNLAFDVLLTKIDVVAGQWGLYNFYKMQIVHQKGKDLYTLFTRWGRIGDSGQYQQTPFPQHDDAVKEFRKIFRSKTGNEWQQINSFEPKPRKYRLVPLEQRNYGRKNIDVMIDFTTSLPSKLPHFVQDLIEELTDMKTLANSMDHLGIDSSVTPLGRMKKDTLLKAKSLLVQLKSLVKDVTKMRSEISKADMSKYEEKLQEIAKLTNDYYHLIPKRGFEFERIPVLDNDHLLESEWKIIESLSDLEIANKIIIGAQHSIKSMHPLDYVYRCLRCQIQLMDENEIESQYLLRYISATWKGKVEAIFRIAREGEDKRLASSGIDNHRLLFHGSSSSNLISILSKGLLIAPPDAPGCGNAFGNGIYTADRFSKSLGYCFNYSMHSKVKYMLVCEVALGKTKDLCTFEYQEKLPENYQSVRGLGRERPDPQFDLTLPTGAVIPLGESKHYAQMGTDYIHLTDSEYIVYREDQVCLRYIIQFVS